MDAPVSHCCLPAGPNPLYQNSVPSDSGTIKKEEDKSSFAPTNSNLEAALPDPEFPVEQPGSGEAAETESEESNIDSSWSGR